MQYVVITAVELWGYVEDYKIPNGTEDCLLFFHTENEKYQAHESPFQSKRRWFFVKWVEDYLLSYRAGLTTLAGFFPTISDYYF